MKYILLICFLFAFSLTAVAVLVLSPAQGAASFIDSTHWERIADSPLADAWMEKQIYRSQDSTCFLTHFRIRNKSNCDIGVDTESGFSCYDYAFELPSPVCLSFCGTVPAPLSSIDAISKRGDFFTVPARWKEGKLQTLHEGETYEYFAVATDDDQLRKDIKQNSRSRRIRFISSGDMYVTNGVLTNTISTRTPCYASAQTPPVRRGSCSIDLPFRRNKIDAKFTAAPEDLPAIEQALKSERPRHSSPSIPVAQGWNVIKDGSLAAVSVQDALYQCKYNNSIYTQIAIQNKSDQPLKLCLSRLFYPSQWIATNDPEKDLPYIANSGKQPSFEPNRAPTKSAEQTNSVNIEPGQSFRYFAAYPSGWNSGYCKEKHYLVGFSGYCIVTAVGQSEVLSLSFDDHKEFNKCAIACFKNEKVHSIPSTSTVFYKGSTRPLSSFRQDAIVKSFELSRENALSAISRGDRGGYVALCEYYFSQGNFEAADKCNEQLRKCNPESENVPEFRGRILNAQGRYREALVELGKCSHSCYYKAYAHFKLGDYQRALELCNREVDELGGGQYVYLLRAQVREASGQFEAAEKDYALAIAKVGSVGETLESYELSDEQDGNGATEQIVLRNAEAHFRRAALLRKMGKSELARADERKALQLGYTTGMNSCAQFARAL